MAPATDKRPVVHDDLDDYGVDDFGVDPFADSGDENANTNGNSQPQKRQNDADLVGITKAVAVSAKVRVPRVKLDENKLLSDKGISKLRRRAGDLKFKGKGHEVSRRWPSRANRFGSADCFCSGWTRHVFFHCTSSGWTTSSPKPSFWTPWQ
jgi:hypothetical protein